MPYLTIRRAAQTSTVSASQNRPGLAPFQRNALAASLALALSAPALAANYNVTQANDDGTGGTSGSLSWAILEANTAGGTNTITLTTDVALSGVMTRLINGPDNSNFNLTIQSDSGSRNISCGTSGSPGNFRPFFVKSGSVTLSNLNINYCKAQGGSGGFQIGSYGGGGGAGLGGALFVYAGDVVVDNVNFSGNSAVGGGLVAIGSTGQYGGGGGMFGAGAATGSGGGGGGLFASASGTSNAVGYAGGAFGAGGVQSFGGGGVGTTVNGSNGGFGGGGGAGAITAAKGGFGGGGGSFGSGRSGGFGAGAGGISGGGAGGGLGGAIFVKTGTLTVKTATFTNNTATGGVQPPSGAGRGAVGSGYGGAIFVCTTDLDTVNDLTGAKGGCAGSINTGASYAVTFSGGSATTAQPDIFWSDGTSTGNGTVVQRTVSIPLTSGPSVSTIAPASSPAVNATSMSFTVTFSEAVSGVDASDFTLTATGGVLGTIASVSGSGTTYTVTVNTISGTGSLRLDLNSSGTGIAATAAGNAAIGAGYISGTVHIVDTNAPNAPSVAGPTNASYKAAQTLSFVATFNEAVTVTGTPRIAVTVGSSTVYASYVSGSGGTTLTFSYVVQAGDTDTNGIAIASPIDLNGGTIQDAATNNATLTYTAPTLTGVLVDTTAPAAGATPINVSDADTSHGYTVGDVISLNFSEPIAATGLLSNLTVSGGHSLGSGAIISPASGYASSYTITLGTSPTAVTADTLTLAAANAIDAATNQAAGNIVFTLPNLALTAQTVTFAPATPVNFGVSPITLSASSTSGLSSFSYSTSSLSSICTISGSTLTITGPGTCVITATQAGNGTYAVGTSTANVVINPSANGACGGAQGQAVSILPSANLCTTGTASNVTAAAGGYSWSCAGVGSGAPASCTAPGAIPPGSTGTATFELLSGSGCALWSINLLAPPAGGPGNGVTMPYGVVDFVLVSCTADRATVRMTYSGTIEGMQFWKYINATWRQVSDVIISGNTATFTIVDNGPYDADNRVGVIADPGGPGVGPNAASIPTLSEWAMIALSGLLGLLGVKRLSRRKNTSAI
jgi:hypothetical protein